MGSPITIIKISSVHCPFRIRISQSCGVGGDTLVMFTRGKQVKECVGSVAVIHDNGLGPPLAERGQLQ